MQTAIVDIKIMAKIHLQVIIMDERIKKQLAFSLETDKVKNILSQTRLSGHGRRENDAEHSRHMALMTFCGEKI